MVEAERMTNVQWRKNISHELKLKGMVKFKASHRINAVPFGFRHSTLIPDSDFAVLFG